MAKDTRQEELRRHFIPVNFIDESKVFNGMINRRNAIEGGILFGVVAFILWRVLNMPLTTKISIVLFISLPVGMIGVLGIGGDPLSTFLMHFRAWRKTRGLMLYNNETRALRDAPVKLMMEEEGLNDKLLNILDARKEKKAQKRAATVMIEGETFEFAPDTSLAGNYLDESVTEDDADKDSEPAVKKTEVSPIEIELDGEDDVELIPMQMCQEGYDDADDSVVIHTKCDEDEEDLF